MAATTPESRTAQDIPTSNSLVDLAARIPQVAGVTDDGPAYGIQDDAPPIAQIPSLWNVAFREWENFDPAEIEPRRWVYGRHYLACAVSATIADGGVGKSTLALTEAVAIVVARPLLGILPNRPPDYESTYRSGVLYYNAEEPLDEIKRRVAAICQHYEIDPKVLARTDYYAGLTIISGHDHPLVIDTADRNGIIFNERTLKYLELYDGDVIILDPLISVRQVPENDNTMNDVIMKRLGRIASSRAMKAIELVHHSRKPPQGGTVEINGADARGASAVFDGVRSLRMLNRMTEAEAARANVTDARAYFRVNNGKSNYTAMSFGSQWFRHQSVILPNGDDVGVIVPWHMPGAFDGVTAAHLHAVRDLARGGQYRADPRSPDWIGGAVADVLHLDAESEAHRKRIKIVLKEWYENGVLKKVERLGPTRHPFMYVEPGEWTEE